MAVQISGNDITVPRDGSFTRNVTIGGTLTYEDVTNIDSVGLVTARNGIEIGARPGVAASISVDGNMIVSGISTFNGDVKLDGGNLVLGDSGGSNDDRIKLGASSDLQIFCDGTHSSILNTNASGYINIDTDNFRVRDDDGSENIIRGFKDAAVELYFNNSKKLETGSSGIVVTGQMYSNSAKIVGAAGGDSALELYSDAGGQDADKVRIRQTHVGNSFLIESYASGAYQSILKGTDSRTIELHHQGTKMIETISTGTRVPDGKFAKFGDGEDMSMGHNVYNYITYTGSEFRLTGDSTNSIRLMPVSNETSALFNPNGSVQLYHNNIERLATFSEGLSVHVAGNSGLRIIGATADVNPRLVFRRKNNDGNNSEPAAIQMTYLAGTTHESGHLDFFTNGDSGSAALTQRMRIRNDGALLINTTTQTSLGSHTGASNVVTVNRSGIVLTAYSVVAGFYYDRINYTNSQYYIVNDSGTGVYLGNGNTSWTANSDERLKINITELDGTKAYNHVKTARATSYNWNATGHSTDKKIGFIAQDWETNYPEVVSTSTETVDGVENPKGIQYTETVPVLMAALKEAIAKIETLETEVAALKSS